MPCFTYGCIHVVQPRVLLFDFGSGESKWMLYSLTKHRMVEIVEGDDTREVSPARRVPSRIASWQFFATSHLTPAHRTWNLGANILGTRVALSAVAPKLHRSQDGGKCGQLPLARSEEENDPGRESHWRCTVPYSLPGDECVCMHG